MERKIIQVAEVDGVMVAVCNDGTLLGLSLPARVWKVMSFGPVPQPPLDLDKLMEGVTEDNKHDEEKL